jgi:hypothetical protein
MKQVRSVEFLPEIFQTPINDQFLSATLDQLIQNPRYVQTQGFVGRRIGPGVNANDRYVVEPTKTRTDYQLEPGVVQVNPENTSEVVDAITYPGINDALRLQGSNTDNADRLYTSDYYTWDPFVDLDKFVNYAQYYWLPSGPLAVDVSSTSVPLTDNFVVTRANGVYEFSGAIGTNPEITLVRGGSYTFQVAQNNKETENFRVTNNDTSSWNIDYSPNPTLTLVRGNTYVFNLELTFPWAFWIKTAQSFGTTDIYSNGVFNNGGSGGLITFTVPQDAPDTLFYCNDIEFNLRGQINIVDATPGTGPGFFIQADPGVNGRMIATPNISSRDVLGVTNNGEDLGTVTFDVPLATAQNFYYDMPSIGTVDLICNLQFDQINGLSVETFLSQFPTGIDGITNLNGRTLIFTETNTDPDQGGWLINSPFDPLIEDSDNNGLSGSYDSLPFSQTTPITDVNVQRSIWLVNYQGTPSGGQYITLSSIAPAPVLNKFTISFGIDYSSTGWYKNDDGFFEQIPLLTAGLNRLYYQDGTDPEIFGRFNIIDNILSSTLDVESIIGASNYVSPNGVIFSNGMKVVFRGDVYPASYQNNEYYVEGVGTAIQLLPVTNYVTPETYTQNASIPYDTTAYDVGNYDGDLNQPLTPDYLTINRSSPDLNAWARSNRWCHIDVITASAQYNNTTPIVNNNFRARRPILEFRGGTRLFASGTQALAAIDIIDLAQTDALSNVNGSLGYSVDGYTLIDGSTIIFANDIDPEVRKTVYRVQFVITSTNAEDSTITDVPVIVLSPVSTAVIDNSVVVLSGLTLQGFSYYYDGLNWLNAQQKISVNQPPRFDLYDANGISFGDQDRYPSSNFTGSPLFSYAIGDADPDLVLGFPLTYLSLTNLGDIVFDNNFYKDTFSYTINNSGNTQQLSTGFARQYSNRTEFVKEIGWQTAVTSSLVRQQFQFTYDGSPLLLDVAVNENTTVPAIQIYVDGKFQAPSNYQYTVGTATTTINLLTTYVPGTLVEVSVLSDQISKQGFYEVPINLSNNPLNGNSNQFTLGTIRNHYTGLAENLVNLSGPPIGANNTRDLGNIIPYGLQILQQSSPLTLTGYFMRDAEYDIFAALAYNSAEYIKFKSQLLNAVTTFGIAEYSSWTVAELLDASVQQITAGKTSINPFYWSDMLPAGATFVSNSYTVNPITTNTFNTQQTYDFSQSNYLGLCVYVNNVLLTRGVGYVVSTDGPTLTIIGTLAVGDVITINEYSDTAGNFVPNTPTKLGLYPKYEPRFFYDTSYANPTFVIQGHDGSITTAFGTLENPDPRDQVLLEFETRIYNNLKNDGNPVPLVAEDVIPGYFRTTDYTQAEVNQILGEEFLAWVGGNKLDYTTQTYVPTNEFTYNYSQAGNRLDNQPLLGAWRGIYRWFYDTTSPATTPWEMLGFSEQPDWWTDRYGPVPYTSDNLVLWDDLEAGLVADPAGYYVIPKYRRPGLTSVIPVNNQGELLPPFYSVMGAYNPQGFAKSWQVGDGGPVEASWWMSSSYPFSVMRLLILTRPAEFFNLFADRDLYKYDADFDQFLYNSRYRLRPQDIQLYGNGVSKASYINWIVDYNQQTGVNSTDALATDLANLDVRLCYRMASFASAQNLTTYLEKSSPNSENSSLSIPPESYNLLLYKNQPFNSISYSAVIVEVVENGYSVYGYNSTDPYFSVLASRVTAEQQTLNVGNVSVTVPAQYSNKIVQVPYGYTFTNLAGVIDFLLSYGEYLTSQGLTFTAQENGYTLNWLQMAQEFLYFANQGWATGTIINLNPSATQVISFRPGAVVDSIVSYTPENLILDQNRRAFDAKNLVIQRLGNVFTLNPAPGGSQTISYLRLKFTDYENMLVFSNQTIFNDLIYNPTTGERQSRLKLVAATSTDWNGTLNAPGFILNQNNVKAWQANAKYTKGEIVLYKNNYWQAATIVPPKIKFDYSDWLKSNYDRISQGLLQNLATKSDQLATSYDTQTANLNSDNDLLAFGLIGFRPRQYMTDLNLSDTSQVNLYQQFIKTKGTTRATDLFTQVNFGPLTAQYRIYENWGILAGTYGANANRSWFEIVLDEARLTGNPSTVQIVQPNSASQANQTVQLNNLWAESYKIPNTDILPTTYTTNTDTALPSAGYVNIDDVDITVFSLNDPSSIASNLNIIGNGTKIWVAKDNSYDWNIYQCAQVPGRLTQLTDNLNGTSRAQFSTSVDLAVGDLIIIRYFNDAVDGVYRVLSKPSINTVVIQYAFANSNQTSITGTGLVFYLQTMRVAQASDVASLPYASQLTPGATAWVDNDGSGHWQVLQKTNPFATIDTVSAIAPEPNSLFGTSVSQSSNHYALLVGAPAAANGAGVVYSYRLGNVNDYVENDELRLTTTGTVGYGNSVDFGDRTWAVVGASASNSGAGYATLLYLIPGTNDYVKSQILVEPNQNFSAIGFGSTVKISANERWVYISAPGANNVYAYGRVDVPLQSVTYIAPGNTATFNYSDTISIDPVYPEQLIVVVGNFQARYGVDYIINANLVQFLYTPSNGETITISRRTATQLDNATYFGVTQNSTTGIGSGAEFTVTNTRGTYTVTLTQPGTGYANTNQLTIDYTQVDPGGTVANNITITVDEVVDGGITRFTATGSGVNNSAVFSLTNSLYTIDGYDSFTVTVDNVLQRPYIDYTFNTGTGNLTFITLPAPGSTIVVDSASVGAYWKYVDTISANYLDADAAFGTSIATDVLGQQLLIGAPFDSAENAQGQVVLNAGAVYAFDRGIAKYIITDPTQLTYAIPGTATDPLSVVLNNQYLTNTAQYINGQFTVIGSDIVLSDDITLTVGDTLEIETNQFQLVQKIIVDDVIDESQFGQSVAICSNSCSVYAGAPLDSFATGVPQAGMVQREVNQSKIYGITSSTADNPVLTPGDTLRINNIEVSVPASPNNTVAGLVDAINNSGIPNVIATNSTNVNLIGDGSTKIFNIGSIYSSASAYNTVVYINTVLQTPGVHYTYNNTTQQLLFVSAPTLGAEILVIGGRMTVSVINSAATERFNKLTVLPGLTADDSTIGSTFDDLGFNTYAYTQTIVSPRPTDFAQFGASVSVNTGATNLVVGSPNGNVYEPTTFDAGETYFDDRSTTFFSSVNNSGIVYTFDYLPSASDSITDPGQFVFGQQVYTSALQSGDDFGIAVDYRNSRLLVGAPGSDLGDSSVNYGSVYVLDNATDSAVWQVIHEQQPMVDVNLLNSVFSYDKLLNSKQTYFDYIDPLQGKILGVARRNIDYIGAVDPASYNAGTVHNIGTSWGAGHVGEIWWDTDQVRFIDANQDSLVYASRRWGQVFPGSTIDCYQWTASTVPPALYTGTGTPFSTSSYTVYSSIDNQGLLVTTYFYWVKGINTVATQAGKTLSPTAVASYIQNPVSSGLPFIAALSANALALYNATDLLSADNTILHVEYDRQAAGSTADIHQEYEFIAQGRPDAFLNANLYRKLLDSFCGATVTGALVPDPLLSPGMQYGVQFRPRQSMFINRFQALQNYIGRANTVLAQYPISETRNFNLLNSAEPVPASNSGAWDFEVPNLEVLNFQNLYIVPLGYKYLVANDASQNGRWSIYELANGTIAGQRVLNLIQVQTYDTTLYWNYVDWYLPGYNSTIQPVVTVSNVAGLQRLSLTTAPIGSSVRVSANGQGKFEIYLRTDTGWDRVGLQDGTIEFSDVLWNYQLGGFGFDAQVFDSTYFDQEPTTETRNIIRAINEELFVDDLLIERNKCLTLVFQYIYSEFTSPNWLIKTSYITVDHVIRGLLPYELYQPDNQTFVLDYLNEVKPYHVQNLAFNLIYDGIDLYPGSLTDYDVPAYWNTDLSQPQFVSPVLTPYTFSNSVNQSFVSDANPDAQIWLERPWNDWFNNYTLSVQSITVVDNISTYSSVPIVTIGAEWTANTSYALGEQIFYADNLYTVTTAGTTGTVAPRFNVGSLSNGTAVLTYSGARAQAVAVLRANKTIATVTIINGGSGYLTTPMISVSDPNDSSLTYGNELVAVMGNNLVRSIKTTIKYDRYQYNSDIVEWSYLVPTYATGTQVRYQNQVWQADSTISNTPITTTATTTVGSFNITVSSTVGLVQGMLVTAVQLPANTAIGDITGTVISLTKAAVGDLNNTTVNFYKNFDLEQWTSIDAGLLSGVDRTMGFYNPTVNMPGLSLPLLIDGVDYPGVQVSAPNFNQNTGFDVGNYDINPYDNISFDAEGRPTYDPGILDATYSSAYLDPYLGTRATDINVDGGAYIDTYSSHAPEELVPGSEFDTLDLRVYTRPGSDWLQQGHGFPSNTIKYELEFPNLVLSFAGAEPYTALIFVSNQTQGIDLHLGTDYTVNYVDQTVTMIPSGTVQNGDVIVVTVYEIGGGNQLYKAIYNGADIGNTVTVPVAYYQLDGTTPEIQEFVVFVNGVLTTDYTYAADGAENVTVTFGETYTATDSIALYVLAPTVVELDQDPIDYSWSAPQTQIIVSDGTGLSFSLDNSLSGCNPDCLIVTVNGIRAKTAAGIRHIADGSTGYNLPDRIGVNQSIIVENEVRVYVDDVPQLLGVDFVVEPWDGPVREVLFATEPPVGSEILIYVTTNTQAYVNGDQLLFNVSGGLVPSLGDIISVTTWNDTRQQRVLSRCFVGPVTTGITVEEPYDTTDFDVGDITNAPGSFDYAEGVAITTNSLDLGIEIADPDRLWVSLNGRRLFNNQGFVISGTELVLTSGILSPADVVMITQFTNAVVPEAMAFRIFQDMRGVQAIYRITDSTTTTTTAPVSITDDIIQVDNASALPEPDFSNNIWGVVTINAERIMYRERNVIDNTISGLLRGTAGTAIAEHQINSLVYNMGRGNLLPEIYQNYVTSNTFMGDDTTVEYTTDFAVDNRPIVYIGGSVEVYLDNIQLPTTAYTVTQVEPVAVVLNLIPQSGRIVTVQATYLDSTQESIQLTSTGSSARFVTDFDIGLEEQDDSTFVLDNFNPVTITFDTAPPVNHVVYIRNQRGAENEFDFSFANGTQTTFATDIDLSLPVEVYIGGVEIPEEEYQVISLDPVVVIFDVAPPSGVEVLILVNNGVSWYEPGIDSASNGEPLQVTQTEAARFLRGE